MSSTVLPPPFEILKEEELRYLELSLSYFDEIRDKDLQDTLFGALIPYYWASIDEELDDSTFKYWICIEQLLLKSQDTKEADLVKRIKNFPILKGDRFLDYGIENLYEKRNSYAHEYNADFHQIERNLAKQIADMLIRFLLAENQHFFKKRELSRFYELLQKDSDRLKQALDDIEKMTNLILELRQR